MFFGFLAFYKKKAENDVFIKFCTYPRRNLGRFDDSSLFETRTLEEWVAVCLDRPDEMHGEIMEYVKAGEFERALVRVTGLDENGRLLVTTLKGRVKTVQRLALRFLEEDHAVFALRQETARKMRKEYDDDMAFNAFVDSQPTEEVAAPDEGLRSRLAKRFKAESAKTVEELFEEIERDYIMAMKLSKVKEEHTRFGCDGEAVVIDTSVWKFMLERFLPYVFFFPTVEFVFCTQADSGTQRGSGTMGFNLFGKKYVCKKKEGVGLLFKIGTYARWISAGAIHLNGQKTYVRTQGGFWEGVGLLFEIGTYARWILAGAI